MVVRRGGNLKAEQTQEESPSVPEGELFEADVPDFQEGKEEPHACHRAKVRRPAGFRGGRRAPTALLAQHRRDDSEAERRAIDGPPRKAVEKDPRASEEVIREIPDDVIVEVAERGGRQDGQGDAYRSQRTVSFSQKTQRRARRALRLI